MHSFLFSERLAYFTTVYRIGSYSDAARAIPMSYQGLVKAIRALEADVGASLFTQVEGTHLTPTPYADRLYQLALNWNADVRKLDFEFRHMAGDARRVIHLGAATGAMGYLGLDAARDFEREHPHLALSIEECPDLLVDRGLRDGDYDFAITVAPYDSRFRTHTIARIRGFAVVHKDNPKSRLTTFSPQDFENEVLLSVGPQYKTYEVLKSAFDEAQIALDSWLFSSELFWLYAQATENKGISLIAAHAVALLNTNDQVVAIPCGDDHWEIGLSRLALHTPDDDEKALLAFLLARCEQRKAHFGI